MPIRLTAETSTISTIGQYHSPEKIRSDSCNDGCFRRWASGRLRIRCATGRRRRITSKPKMIEAISPVNTATLLVILPPSWRAICGLVSASLRAARKPIRNSGLRAVVADDPHRRAFVADVEHHHHAQQHRGGKDAAAGGVGQTQRQRAADRGLQKVADVQRQRQADQRRHGVRQQVTEQILTALAGAQPAALAQTLGQQAAEHRQATRKRRARRRTTVRKSPATLQPERFDGLVDQFVDFIGGAIGAQAPGVDQVFVEIELVLHIVDARTDRAEQTALHHRLGFGRLLRRRPERPATRRRRVHWRRETAVLPAQWRS